MGSCLMGYSVSVWDNEKVVEKVMMAAPTISVYLILYLYLTTKQFLKKACFFKDLHSNDTLLKLGVARISG